MNIVIDANIIFSLLIKEDNSIKLFLDYYFNFYSPEFVLEEIGEHKKEIIEKAKCSEKEFDEIFDLIKSFITIIPKEEFKIYLEQAKIISPDPDDIMYFALALRLNCPIWSNDKGFKKQDKVKVYSTQDLIRLSFI